MNHSIILLLALALMAGLLSPAYAQTLSSPVSVTVSSDKPSYLFNDTVIIQGTVSKIIYVEQPYFQTEPILINISGPNYYQSVSLYPDSDLGYETTLKLIQVLGINEGTYDVYVSYGGVIAETDFSVGHEIIEEQDQLDDAFSIQTEESEYLLEELITLTGFSSEVIPFESMQFTVTDPNGKQIASGNLFTTDGTFNTVISVSSYNIVYGTYVITAQYSDQTSTTTFSIVEEITEEMEVLVSDSMHFILDGSEYVIGDSLSISGVISNFDSDNHIYYQVVTLTFLSSDGKPVTFIAHHGDDITSEKIDVGFTAVAVPNSAGEFTVDVKIPPIIFSEGSYVLNAKYGSLVDSKTFSIVSEKSITTPHVRTIIEKTNRISDDSILINTQGKIIEDQSVKPRVLSGSMVTTSKDSLSDVNLQVVSDSGICIIGQADGCLVSDSTRKPGQIFDVVEVDGLSLNVRYTGPDVRLEKFSILPESSDEFLPDTNWNVVVIKDDEISRFYYKVTYKTLE